MKHRALPTAGRRRVRMTRPRRPAVDNACARSWRPSNGYRFNKHARMIWAMLARDQAYDPQAWQRHARAQPSAVTAAPAVALGMT